MVRLAREAGRVPVPLPIAPTAPTPPDAVAAALAADPAISHVGVVYSETGSGVVHDPAAIGAVVRAAGRRMIVDAVSAFGALPLDMCGAARDRCGGVHRQQMPGGLPGVAFAVARIDRLEACAGNAGSWSFDLADIHAAGAAQRPWQLPLHAAGAGAECAERRARSVSTPRAASRRAWRATPQTCACCTTGVQALGLTPCLAREHQGPIIVNVHAPADPAWDLQRFVDALKARGVLISNFYNTPTPSFRVGCIGAITPADMRRARSAPWPRPSTNSASTGGEQPDMKTDLEIARESKMRPIAEIAARLHIPDDALEPYGRYKAKVGFDFINRAGAQAGRRAGAGHRHQPDARRRGQDHHDGRARRCAEPHRQARGDLPARAQSLGPSFGMKGGAAGGGYSQVVPMDQINLHFTGDFHAITSANNLLAAMIDNHIYWGNALGIDARRISWRRCLDMNDRALRSIVNSLGGVANGFPREDGFDITVASEVMAVFCLSRNLDDLQERLGKMIVAQTRDGKSGDGEGHQGGRRDGGAAEGRAGAQPGADAGRLARVRAWRTVRQYRAWLQLGDGDAARA